MANMIKRMMRQIRKSISSGKRVVKKTHKHKRNNKQSTHRGGAIYNFDLNDKVGGLPARVALNGTSDGDCPKGNLSDLGVSNYASATGGNRKHKTKLTKKKTNKNRNHKSKI